MRILTLSYEYPPLGGGGSRVAKGLAKALVAAGHEVDVLTMGFRDLPREEIVEGVRVTRVPCLRTHEDRSEPFELGTYVASVLPVALHRARTAGYDVNHTHFIFPDGVVSAALKRLAGLPFVVTAHGSDVPGYNPHRFRTLHRVLAPLWSGVVREAATIVSPSESLAGQIRQQRPSAPIDVIPNGIDPEALIPREGKLNRILAVSRIFERKGLQHLVRALAGQDLGWEVHIAGDGPYLPELRRIAGESRMPVRFHGWLDNDSPTLRELYETSSVFVLPSEAENFPIVLLEAQAAGLAIVTTDSTGCAEVVGDTGLLVPPNDVDALRTSLLRLMVDDKLRTRLAAEGRRRMEDNFSWQAVADRYLEVFDRHRRPPRRERIPAASSA